MTAEGSRLIRFIRAEVKQLDDASCEATVELEHRGVGVFTATARGPSNEQDQLRAVARATSDALSDAYDAQGVRVRVVGVQPVDSLIQRTIMVTLAVSRGSDQRTLFGVAEAGDDPARAAALAVLGATNRFLGILGD